MREEQKPVPTVAEWAMIADAILLKGTREDLRLMAAAALRIGIQATQQVSAWKDESRPDDDELLTPAELAREFRVSPWSVREAIRRQQLKTWRPFPGAVRGCRVARKVARAWAAVVS